MYPEPNWQYVNAGLGNILARNGQQAIYWTKIDEDPRRHMATIGGSELSN